MFMTPRTNSHTLNGAGGVPRSSQVMTADAAGGGYRQPLGNLPVNSFGRQSNSGYGMSAGAKAGKRPLRPYATTPRIDRHSNAPADIPMR